MKLSIVLPVYNAAPFLKACVESIIPELNDNTEIVIVNDGSTDDSGEIAEQFARQYSSIKVEHKKNSGQVETRNLGIRTASGEYVCFIDADDWVDYGYYSEGLSCAIRESADIVMMGYKHDTASGCYTKKFKAYLGSYNNNQIRAIVIPALAGIHYGNIINTSLWNKIFKRELLLRNIDLVHRDLRNGEDSCLFIACLSDAEKLCVLDSGLFYHYVEHANQVSTKYDPLSLARSQRLYETVIKIGDAKCLNMQLLHELVFSQYWKILSQISKLDIIDFKEKKSLINEILGDAYLQKIVKSSKNGGMPYEFLKKLFIRFRMGSLILKMCNK